MMRAKLSVAALCLACAPLAFAHPGIGICAGKDGSVFYTDLENVYRIDPQGRRAIAVPDVHTHELYLDAGGNLFGEHLWYEGERTDTWGHRVWKRKPDGALETVRPATKGFLSGYSFVRDAAGAMYWGGTADGNPATPRSRIVRQRAGGQPEVYAGGAAGTGRRDGRGRRARFVDIRWMVARSDGVVFVVDGTSVRRVDPDGVVRTLASNFVKRSAFVIEADERHSIFGLGPDSEDGVYVAAFAARSVQHVDAQGRLTTFVTCGAAWRPSGVTLAPNGQVLVLETSLRGRVRVRRFDQSGKELASY